MSDKKNNKNRPFTNEDTIVRRAWVESALEGVRERLQTDTTEADISDQGPVENVAAEAAAVTPATVPETAQRPASARPGLYVAWSAPARRSGT